MAEIYQLGGSIRMYNVSYGVGDGMLNNREDVMLVQWLLKRHFARPDKRALLGKTWYIDILNGTYGSFLGDMIKIYQYDAVQSVSNCHFPLNGKIYPIQACNGPNNSVMALLNLSVSGHFKQYYHSPKSDPCVFTEAKEMFERCGTS